MRLKKPCVSVALIDQDRVLLVKRANPPNQGCWSLPGGKQESDETLVQAAYRELKEETGIIGFDFVFLESHILNLDREWADFDYEIHCFAALAHEIDAKADSDASHVIWVDWHDLGTFGVTQSTIEIVALAMNQTAKSEFPMKDDDFSRPKL